MLRMEKIQKLVKENRAIKPTPSELKEKENRLKKKKKDCGLLEV